MLRKYLFAVVAAVAILAASAPAASAQSTGNTNQQQSVDCQQFSKNLESWLKENNVQIDQSKLMEQINKYVQIKQQQKADQSAEQPKKEQPAKAEQPQQAEKEQGTSAEQSAPKQEQKQAESKQSSDSIDQYQPSEYEKQVVKLVNEERSKKGLDPLKMNDRLSGLAHKKSQDMADNNYFSHTSPTYGSPFDMMKQFGFTYKAAGENIAAGQKTPEQVVQGWMNSPGHRANILNENFTEIGVGYVEGSGQYGTYWTQEFITPQ
ncbi:CAP domain-containing protein [Halobacillus salinarum]|uniref:CAP domain-containing protein n=1 Tax=Halobacillus salinarum TaxID=2932257 RepID=A0ABY4ENF9_9BACI|nr:CAP domain-containing protein [Halobacillus salinarum]UOQ45152.1 CAP domain-containing protein [Halobacillus salinarum]